MVGVTGPRRDVMDITLGFEGLEITVVARLQDIRIVFDSSITSRSLPLPQWFPLLSDQAPTWAYFVRVPSSKA